MAVAFDGFSIREYTSKMRSIDVLKCWPFTTSSSDEVSRKDVESWLPPMTVPKFRWWSNELEAVRSNQDDKEKEENQPLEEEISRSESESVRSDKSGGAEEEKLEMVCPVCRVFNAATLTAVNAHIDGCLAQTMREERRQMRMMSLKSKSKAPKKRSIAEIFEVEEEQPQIETVLKFWPFNKNPDEVSITVTKFRWWSRRLEALRSNQGKGEVSRAESELGKSEEGDGVEEDKLEMVCPVCRVFNAATVTAVNAHIDGCLAQAMREERRQMRMSLKPKPKAPKKRSIAEILTVAPQIQARNSEVIGVEEQEEESDNSARDSRGGGDSFTVVSTIKSKKNTNKIRKKKKMKKLKKKSKVVKKYSDDVTLNNEKMMTMNKKKKNLFNNELIAKKEDAYKCNVKTPVSSAGKLKGTISNKRVSLDDIHASAHKKTSNLKFSSVEKKQKFKNFDSVDKQQKAVPLAHGILKNHSKHIFGRTSSSCSIQDDIEEDRCDVEVLISDRDVKFSGEDDILGLKKNSFDEVMFNSSSDALATSLGKEQSSGSGEEAAALEANRSDGNSDINIDRSKDIYPAVESKQFSNTPEQVTVLNFLRPCTNQQKPNHLDEKSESITKVALYENNSLHPFDRGLTTTLHHSPYAGISGPLPAVQAGQISSINTQVGDSRAFSSAGKFIDHLEDPTYQVAAVNSTANTRTFLQPSSSYSATYNEANERPQFPSRSYGDDDDNGQTLGYRALSHMFSADMIDNSFPFAGWGRGSVRNNCMDENFFGLPLNSHGELINFCSSGKGGMNQPQTSSTLRGSSSGLPVRNFVDRSSQESLSSSERPFFQKTLPKDRVNPFPHYPARLGVTELQGGERADNYRLNSDRCYNNYGHLLDSQLNLSKNPFTEHNQCDKVQKHYGSWMISPKESSDLVSPSSSQPTMRLMGKDVPIGRSSKEMQQFVGDVWAGEESKRRHNSEDAALENSFSEGCSKQDWMSSSPLQMSTENVSHSVKIQSTQALQSTLLRNDPNSEFPQPFLDLQTNHLSQNGSLGVRRSASSYLHPMTQTPTSCAVFNRPSDLTEQSISGAKSLGLISQLQIPPTPCNFSQHACLSHGELNDRKKLPHVTSAFEFPFLPSGVGEHVKTSWLQSMPPWLLSSTHENLLETSSQKFSGLSKKSFPYNMWEGNFTAPTVSHSAEVLYPPIPLTTHHHMKSPLCPASIVQPPLVPVTPAIQPTSTINSGCRNKIKVTDRVKLDDMTTGDHHPCKNTRKRPAANLGDSTKPIKLANMGGSRKRESYDWVDSRKLKQ